jgi:hypothetical protein
VVRLRYIECFFSCSEIAQIRYAVGWPHASILAAVIHSVENSVANSVANEVAGKHGKRHSGVNGRPRIAGSKLRRKRGYPDQQSLRAVLYA